MGIQWKAWGTTVNVEVTDPAALASAHRLVVRCLVDAERAADIDRRRSELHRIIRAGGRPTRTGATLSALIAVALDVADHTNGAVDPTVGAATVPLRRALGRAGVSRTSPLVPTCSAFPIAQPRAASGWRGVEWAEHHVTVPAATTLDLTATAKARTARLAATLVATRLGVGALVEIGGDVATAGPAPRRGWVVRPAHLGGGLHELPAGAALAACRSAGVVDPLTGRPVSTPWYAVAVLADDVVSAKAAAVAALVEGEPARERLGRQGCPALFVPAIDRTPVTLA